MKIPEFTFWPYMIVAMGGSYIAFMVVGEFVSNNFESVIGVSGFLIAGSWSFLTIETNKEIRIRDEVLGFINGYEQAILEYVEACNDFVNSVHNSFFFYRRREFYMNKVGEISLGKR
ncbi:hypothetical protein [Halomonas sp. 3F2F]|uniref:hypothetical protein n=1 Tax=Halomonas sp. 3F2F TaxID=1255602 RepID=UPI00186906F7|nr:hypothetical protein [Halomonas sp. 3F2F]